jgi:hypothetical protein
MHTLRALCSPPAFVFTGPRPRSHDTPLRPTQYDALLYGGRIPPVNPDVTFAAVAPASTFSSNEFADLFFKTKRWGWQQLGNRRSHLFAT